MKIELANCTNTLLAEIATKECKRDRIADTYSWAIVSSEPTDWEKVNQAIVERWSCAGLKYIKKKAWRILHDAYR